MLRAHTHIVVILFILSVAILSSACARIPIPTVAPTQPPPTATPIPPTVTPTPVTPTATPTLVPPTPTAAPFIFSSSAFTDGALLAAKYTCDGENISPPLTWIGVPRNAQSLVLMMEDPDAVVTTFTHWIVFDVPPTTTGLIENVKGVGKGGSNSAKRNTYVGPCPPSGIHRFIFQLFALDVETLGLNEGASRADIEKAMTGRVLAKLVITGLYGKK
ncbi:MAG: YbhB/YbcL family Raf kinase inhibitor-like protein [Chloroflexi bacterium]|nr:YbhB/YbcL family Raf kinase inhibitor-like protein [Chloroflexota bacterium]